VKKSKSRTGELGIVLPLLGMGLILSEEDHRAGHLENGEGAWEKAKREQED